MSNQHVSESTENESSFKLKDPPEMFDFTLQNGTHIELPTYTHSGTNRDYVKCDLCGLLVLKANGGVLRQHGDNAKCSTRQGRFQRQKIETEERERAQSALKQLHEMINANGIVSQMYFCYLC